MKKHVSTVKEIKKEMYVHMCMFYVFRCEYSVYIYIHAFITCTSDSDNH